MKIKNFQARNLARVISRVNLLSTTKLLGPRFLADEIKFATSLIWITREIVHLWGLGVS